MSPIALLWVAGISLGAWVYRRRQMSDATQGVEFNPVTNISNKSDAAEKLTELMKSLASLKQTGSSFEFFGEGIDLKFKSYPAEDVTLAGYESGPGPGKGGAIVHKYDPLVPAFGYWLSKTDGSWIPWEESPYEPPTTWVEYQAWLRFMKLRGLK